MHQAVETELNVWLRDSSSYQIRSLDVSKGQDLFTFNKYNKSWSILVIIWTKKRGFLLIKYGTERVV